MANRSTPTDIVIIGGGIIGCTTAYYLSHHPSYSPSRTRITVLEASARGPAQGASGKAGGLVAKWAYPKELVGISFSEHVRLAGLHNGRERWGWRYVGCGSWEGRGLAVEDDSGDDDDGDDGDGEVNQVHGDPKSLQKTVGLEEYGKAVGEGTGPYGTARGKKLGLPHDLNWIRPGLTTSYTPMAPPKDTAQVHPYLFTTSMAALAEDRGVRFLNGAKALSIDHWQNEEQAIRGVEYLDSATSTQTTIPASHVVIAAGAWSPRIFPALPISATRAHSITIQPKEGVEIAPYVLFTEIDHGDVASPEIYARPGNEVYACGPGDDSPLPETVDDVEVDQDACESVRLHVASISKELKEGEVTKRQACFLPSVEAGGGPIIGEAASTAKGLYIATGHTCWGICNAPGTALALAELIMEGKIRSGKLTSLHPDHFVE